MSFLSKYWIWILLAIIVIVALYWFFGRSAAPQGGNTGGSGGGYVGGQGVQKDTFPLKVGSKGNNVKRLQTALNKLASTSPKLTVDGDFGSKTWNAFKQYWDASNTLSSGFAGGFITSNPLPNMVTEQILVSIESKA